jgi:hypothetical protein
LEEASDRAQETVETVRDAVEDFSETVEASAAALALTVPASCAALLGAPIEVSALNNVRARACLLFVTVLVASALAIRTVPLLAAYVSTSDKLVLVAGYASTSSRNLYAVNQSSKNRGSISVDDVFSRLGKAEYPSLAMTRMKHGAMVGHKLVAHDTAPNGTGNIHSSPNFPSGSGNQRQIAGRFPGIVSVRASGRAGQPYRAGKDQHSDQKTENAANTLVEV